MITEGVFQMSIQNNNSLSTNKKVTVGVASVLLGTAVLMGGTTVHADTTPASASQPVVAVTTSAAQSSASTAASNANSAAQSSAPTAASNANSVAQSNASASSSASNATSASDTNSSSAVTAVVSAPTADQVTKSAVAAANIAKIEWANPEQVNKDAQSEGSYVEDLVITWKDGSVTNAKWNLFVKGTTAAQVPAPSASEVTKDPEAAKNIESVEWADPAKVNQDIQKPGEYVEHLVVTWKDGTTTTVKWNLIVKGSQDNNNNNNNGNQNNNNGGQNNNGNNNGNQSNNGANGSTTVVNHGNGHVSVINGSVAGQIVKNNVAASNALPQTGNSQSVAVAALGAVVAMFGLGLVAKKREF